MSTVTVDLPEDVENELDEFVEKHPEYDDRETLLLAFTRVMLATEKSVEDVSQAVDALSAETEDADEHAVEASRAVLEALLEFFAEPRVTDETLERIERSRTQFDRGEYVSLEDVSCR